MFTWSRAYSQEGQSPCLPGAYLCGGHPIFRARSMEHTQSHPGPHTGPHVPVSKLPSAAPTSALSPALCTRKGLLCPGHADKYGNSIFIGCINISVCTYISYIIVQGLKGGPTGQPSSTTATPPFPKALSALCKPRPTASAPASSQEKSLYGEGVRGQGAKRRGLGGGRHA